MSTDGKITLKVATSAGPYENTFLESDTIAEVIDIVVAAMKLVKGDSFELALDGKTLEPLDRKLESFNLKDGTVLQLIATGSGV